MTDQPSAPTAPAWVERGAERQQPPTLSALRDLIAAGSRVNHVVSRRSGLSETELVTLEHLSREQIGPAEVATAWSPAATSSAAPTRSTAGAPSCTSPTPAAARSSGT